MSRRAVAVVATVSMTLGGMITTYVLPVVSATGLRYTTVAEIRSGLVAGLLVALLGSSLAASFVHSRKERKV